MSLSATTIATSIAALNVSGVNIKDLTEIPNEVLARECPVLIPDAAQFLTNLKVTRESFGADSVAFKNVTYTLNYIYLHSEVGEGRGLYEKYQEMVAQMLGIVDAIIADSDLNGCIDNFPDNVAIGVVEDPTGKQFFGARIPIGILEFVNGAT